MNHFTITEADRRASARSAAVMHEQVARAYETDEPVDLSIAARYYDVASDYWRRASDSTRSGMAADRAERCRKGHNQ